MSNIINELRADHANASRLLDILEEQLEVVHNEQITNYELMYDIMQYMTHYPDLYHHPKEDLVLRWLSERDPTTHSESDALRKEHKALAEKGEKLRDTLRVVIDDGLVERETLESQGRDYVEFLRFHMKREEEQVFPLAERTLLDDDWVEISDAMKHMEDPLFGQVLEDDYRSLYEFVVRESK